MTLVAAGFEEESEFPRAGLLEIVVHPAGRPDFTVYIEHPNLDDVVWTTVPAVEGRSGALGDDPSGLSDMIRLRFDPPRPGEDASGSGGAASDAPSQPDPGPTA